MLFSATQLFFAGTVLKVGSSILRGRQADAEGKAAQSFAERNALVLEQDAKAREEKAKFDQIQQSKWAKKIMGKMVVAQAHAGAWSPLVLEEQAYELELENLLIGYEGRTEAERLRDRALMTRIGGKYARMRGKMAKWAGYIGAGASLLSSFATAKSLGMFGGGTTVGQAMEAQRDPYYT